MCGFLLTFGNEGYAAQVRGPDLTTRTEHGSSVLLHHLLHITGDMRPQPFTDGTRFCLFNGEIYNWRSLGDYRSDGECILDAWNAEGMNFTRHLDGEYAIVILDGDDIITATDPFATKPLWYGPDGSVGSYASDVANAEKQRGNQVVRRRNGQILESSTTVKWDLRQHKAHTDDWITAFEQSIAKRIPSPQAGAFLGLSSGYDSGAIACELLHQGADFKTYSVTNKEATGVLNARLRRIPNHEAFELTEDERIVRRQQMALAEPFRYKDRFKDYNYKDDAASLGLAAICSRANRDGRRVYLSGQGADEILSDYGFAGKKRFSHSEFGGLFPETQKLWHSFADGTQIQYLNKEEYTAGHFGIEARYPFLDAALVQEFLWLTAEVKNRNYKSPLHDYLVRRDWPFEKGQKRGFDCGPPK
jgi:asparagine synthetase B (glutamine-hydrolysing)